MYERYYDLERVTRAINTLNELNEPCYDEACQSIREQLHQAIAYETGYHKDMSRYSSMNGN